MHILIVTGMTLPEISDADRARIAEAAGTDATVTVAHGAAEALEAAPAADVILGPVHPPLFAAAHRLRWVHAAASGVDGYLFPEFRESAVSLTGEKGLVGGHLADHAFALLLALTRRLAGAVRAGPRAWERRLDFRRQAIELEGLTMGIVGFGGTGRGVARRAAAFGMRCRAVDREQVAGSAEIAAVEGMEAFQELLEHAGVVTVCCPLTAETRGLFDDAAFAQMRPGALLINVTRGEIVDGDALLRALEGGRLGGAGLDVTPLEPLPADHPLWGFENVVMTPHTAGASQLRARRNLDRFCENLRRHRGGEPLLGLVDKEKGY